jgi:hypothetical protein
MRASGGGAVRRAIKRKRKESKKAAKNILKQQEGFSYGSKSFQQELEKKRKQEAEEKETQRQKNADSARKHFVMRVVWYHMKKIQKRKNSSWQKN